MPGIFRCVLQVLCCAADWMLDVGYFSVDRNAGFSRQRSARRTGLPAEAGVPVAGVSRVMKFLLVSSAFAVFCVVGFHSANAGSNVSMTENDSAYTLDNGTVAARINKRSGDLLSLKFKNLELMGGESGHPYGYWSHSPNRGMRLTNSVTIDPRLNGGERGEVSVKGFYIGAPTTRTMPGAGSTTACDIEIRYGLGAGDSGVYTYSIFTHQANYPATGIGEARFCAKLNADVFDFMTIDAKRNKLMPKPEDWDKGTQMNFKEARRLNTGIYKGQVEHKYDYSAIQFDIPAFGWSSTRHKIGLWFVNPSIEYLSGGATKVELTGHLDNNEGATPTLLNYWRGSHYGGSVCAIGEGEKWSKVIGPFLIYCNSGSDPRKLWKDALNKADKESKVWPYDWVQTADYPHKHERGSVEGQIVLNDPQAPDLEMSNVLVGLAAPDYLPPRPASGLGAPGSFSFTGGGEDEARTNANTTTGVSAAPRSKGVGGTTQNTPAGREIGRGRNPGVPDVVSWQNDAKYYQFWVRADDRGHFTIPKVRPGAYTLHAIADGVLGEAVRPNITVEAGGIVELGRLQWTPLRFGRQLWEIGIPNRSAEEFRHGDHYWQWGLYNEYAKEFPNDVNFVIGTSNPLTDWNYAQVPRGPGEGTTWSIRFNLTNAPQGKAALRVAVAGVSLRGGVQVRVNGKDAGNTGSMLDTATIRRDGIRGYWSERSVFFKAALLKSGTNVMTLSIPAGTAASGIEYDYLRLELDEKAVAE